MTFSTSFEDKTRFRSGKNNTLLTKDGQALEWNEAETFSAWYRLR